MWMRQKHNDKDWKYFQEEQWHDTKPKHQNIKKRTEWLTYAQFHRHVLNIPKDLLSNQEKEWLLGAQEMCGFIDNSMGLLYYSAKGSHGIVNAIADKLEYRYGYKTRYSKKQFKDNMKSLIAKGYIYDVVIERHPTKNKTVDENKWKNITLKIDYRRVLLNTVIKEGALF